MRKPLILILMLAAGLGTGICQARQKSKPKPQVDQAQKNAGFEQLFATVFAQWDANHDGKLDLKELNAVIDNPQTRGNESAIAVYFHRRLQVDDEDKANGLTLAETMTLADDPAIQKNISGKAWHIEKINHALFAPDDPNLLTFHQGGIGDCYLLAVIGTFVFQHPQWVRTMITPLADGAFQVQFGDGKKVNVAPVTDAELIMGASEGSNHGVWLSVLEKAYAQIDLAAKERKTGKTIQADDAVMTDFIGHGGYYGPVIKLLTGHQTAGAPFGRWMKKDPQAGLEKAHELLAKLSSEHKLMAVCITGDKSRPLPKGIVHGHIYGVLGYDPVNRTVTVFNPWGNHVKPAGVAGLIHGYPTRHGIFEVPLTEFVQVFAGFTYETNKPVKSR